MARRPTRSVSARGRGRGVSGAAVEREGDATGRGGGQCLVDLEASESEDELSADGHAEDDDSGDDGPYESDFIDDGDEAGVCKTTVCEWE